MVGSHEAEPFPEYHVRNFQQAFHLKMLHKNENPPLVHQGRVLRLITHCELLEWRSSQVRYVLITINLLF